MTERQKTISSPIRISGAGLHSGGEVTLTFRPAPENHGFRFRRTDLEGNQIIQANADYVSDTLRGTSIEHDGVRVETIEHVLAALSGLELDNVLIELDNVETPILDGSSKLFVDALLKAGIEEQKALREYFILDENISLTLPEKNVEMLAIPSNEFRVSVMIDYETNVLPAQHATLKHIKDFKQEIACCRTFVFLHELDVLLKNDLIKGGDLKNAIVFVDRLISRKELDKMAAIFNQPKISILKEGILNNTEMNFSNEPARHKLLDVIGDLALVGMPIKAHIIASRPGHQTNVQFARMLKKKIRKSEEKNLSIPKIDLTKPPLLNIVDIQKILPHRPPFLFIDKILEMSDKHVVGLKNMTMNETFFVGHFPGEPVTPGVILIEAMAQTGGILVLSSVPDPENYITLFLKIEHVKFRQKVIPGDSVIFKLSLVSPIRRGICNMRGIASVGNKIVMEAEMMAQITKK